MKRGQGGGQETGTSGGEDDENERKLLGIMNCCGMPPRLNSVFLKWSELRTVLNVPSEIYYN